MTIPDFENITLGAWLDFWYETYKKPTLKAYSVRNIEQVIRLHTPAWLKEKRLADITIFDVDKALSVFRPCRTLVYVKQVWHNAFQKAMRMGLLEKNVLQLTDKVKYRKQRGNALTIAEQKDFLQRIEGSRYEWVFLFYLHTGVRRSEALFLRWEDVDELSGLILIRGTKTEGSFRHILLTEGVKRILEGQRAQNARERGTRYDGKHPERVFDYDPQCITKAFKRYCSTHHLHDLRHTYITRCAESGVNVAVCQALVGHSTPQLTMGVYMHVMDSFKRREAMKFTLNPLEGENRGDQF